MMNNIILFQKPRGQNKKYEDENWKIRFEVSYTSDIFKAFHQ
jgi:hypothetical protein